MNETKLPSFICPVCYTHGENKYSRLGFVFSCAMCERYTYASGLLECEETIGLVTISLRPAVGDEPSEELERIRRPAIQIARNDYLIELANNKKV